MRITTVLLVLLFSGTIISAQTTPPTFVKNDKNPGSAFLMGLLVPGVGQLYNDQLGLGFGIMAGSAALVLGGLSVQGSDGYSNATEVGNTMITAGGVIWLAGAVHAAFTSRQINRKTGVALRLSKQGDTGLALGVSAAGPCLVLSF